MVGLLLLAFLGINPIGSSAYAEEADDGNADYDDQIMAAADSGVTISFSPTSGSASLTPVTEDGASAKINVMADVQIASTGGYTIYLRGKNAALTGSKTGATIPGATTATTFYNMATNTWGYAVAEGEFVSDTATYAALPQGQGRVLASASGNAKNITKRFALSFATKIGNDKPADTYENQITLSVVSSPLQTTLTDIANMQDMTASICEASFPEDTKQLRDTRDGKYYWVTKLADGKCWMTQNLDLDLSTSKTLTSADTDLGVGAGAPTTYKPAYSSATTASSSTILADNVGQRSWSLGDYRIKNPAASSDCGPSKNSLSQCTNQFTAYNTPTTANGDVNAHYIAGNYYQWNVATAGTGGTITSGQATSSICPKGWKLPSSNTTTAGSFGGLINVYNIGSDVAKIASKPLYFVRGGYVDQNTYLYLFNAGGYYGYYWSSTPFTSAANAYDLYFGSTTEVFPSYNHGRQFGFSIRCVAR